MGQSKYARAAEGMPCDQSYGRKRKVEDSVEQLSTSQPMRAFPVLSLKLGTYGVEAITRCIYIAFSLVEVNSLVRGSTSAEHQLRAPGLETHSTEELRIVAPQYHSAF